MDRSDTHDCRREAGLSADGSVLHEAMPAPHGRDPRGQPYRHPRRTGVYREADLSDERNALTVAMFKLTFGGGREHALLVHARTADGGTKARVHFPKLDGRHGFRRTVHAPTLAAALVALHDDVAAIFEAKDEAHAAVKARRAALAAKGGVR